MWHISWLEIGESLKVFTRLDYGILDWLSDIGGLYKILQIGAFLLISNLIEDGPTLYLTTTMISRPEDRINQRREFTEKSKALEAHPQEIYDSGDVKTHCCIYMRLKLGRFCCCCRESQKDRFIKQAYKNIQQEFDIGKLFKKLNVFEGTLKQ